MQPRNELQPDTDLGEFRLLEEIAPRTWRARHLITPREVCLRILARSTASDSARRDEILERVRSAATIAHPAFPVVRSVGVADDWIVMTTDLPAGVPYDVAAGGRRLPVKEWGRLAWQLASALDALHKGGVVHGALDGGTVRLDEGGNVRIDGLSYAALTGRIDRGDASSLAGELTPSQMAHRSPEALAGMPVDARSDLFSLGVILYRALTGVSPFDAATYGEVVQRVTAGNPKNPREIDPDLPAPMLTVVGRSLFKKPSARYADAASVLADLRAWDRTLEERAAYPRSQNRPAEVRRDVTNLFVADIPFWEMLQSRDPEKASRAAARMQQYLGESVYLYDGEVLDSLGQRFIGVVPEASGAVTAAYRALDETGPASPEGDFEPRMLIVRGEIERDGSKLSGHGLEKALEVLESLSPGQVLIGGDILEAARLQPSDASVGSFGQARLFALPARMPAETAPTRDESTVLVAPMSGEETVSIAVGARPSRRSWLLPAILGLALVVAALAAFLWLRRGEPTQEQVRTATPATAAQEALLVGIVLPTEGTLPAESLEVGRMTAAALRELLRGRADVTLVDESLREATRLTFIEPASEIAATETTGTTGTAGTTDTAGETVEPAAREGARVAARLDADRTSPAFDAESRDEAVRGLIAWTLTALGLPSDQITPPAGAGAAYGRATLAMLNGNRDAAATAATEAVKAAPDWIPGWRVALAAHEARADRAKMLEAARAIARLRPEETEVQRMLAVASIEDGDPVGAMRYAGAILKTAPNDPYALEMIGRYALSADEPARFERAVARLEQLPDASTMRRLHRGDPYAIHGNLDAAIERYFTAEERDPENAALAFKIGRVAALRGSFQTAELELEKLRRLDPEVGAPLVEAFILAQRRDYQRIPALLEKAQKSARWNDDVWTHTAEIWAKAGERRRVMEALERALARGEANETLVLRQKPFFYLGYDARGSALEAELQKRREAMKLALGEVGL